MFTCVTGGLVVAGVTTMLGVVGPVPVEAFCPAVTVLNSVSGLLPMVLGVRVRRDVPPEGLVIDRALGLLLPPVTTRTKHQQMRNFKTFTKLRRVCVNSSFQLPHKQFETLSEYHLHSSVCLKYVSCYSECLE